MKIAVSLIITGISPLPNGFIRIVDFTGHIEEPTCRFVSGFQNTIV